MRGAARAYWDRVAGEKTFGHPLDVDLLGRLAPGRRVLDCGCGYGRLAGPLRRAGFRSTGVDPSLEMARRARAGGQPVAVIGSGGLPFGDGAFDAVLLFTVLTCVPDDGDQRAIVAELERVLRPGGIVYASDLLLQDDERNRRRYEAARDLGTPGAFRLEGTVFRHHDEEWIERLFAAFEPIERRRIDVTTMNGNRARGLQWIGRRAAGQGRRGT